MVKIMSFQFKNLLKKLSWEIQEHTAKHSENSFVLTCLSHSNDSDILETLASNSRTPHEVLDFLSKHDNAAVRRGVACNMKTHSYLLAQLSYDKHPFVVECVAGNVNTPPWILKKLSIVKNTSLIVALNSGCPPALL